MPHVRKEILAFRNLFACVLGNDPKNTVSVPQITAIYNTFANNMYPPTAPGNYITYIFETFIISHFSNQEVESFNRESNAKSPRYSNLAFIVPSLYELADHLNRNLKNFAETKIQRHTDYLFWLSLKESHWYFNKK